MRGSVIRLKLDDIIKKAKSYPRIELLFLITVASIFMPFPITGIALFVLGIYAITNQQAVLRMLKFKCSISLKMFCILALLVPLCYRWWIGVLAGIILIFIVIFFQAAQMIMTRKLYNKALDICCNMSMVCFMYALAEKVINGLNYRSTGGMLNANYYGTIIEFVVIICIYRIIVCPRLYKRYMPIIAINIIGLFLCDCQSAWIPIFLGTLIMMYFTGHKKYALAFLVIAISLGVVFVLVFRILPRMEMLPQTFEKRLNIWQTSIKGILKYPFFGRGSLGYMDICKDLRGYVTYHSHSLYLESLLSYGIVGTILLLAYIFTKVNYLRKVRLGAQSRAVKSLIFAVLCAIFVHGITDYTIFWLQTGMLFSFVMSGIAIPKQVINK